MGKLLRQNIDYAQWIREISNAYRRSQIKAVAKVNAEMLKFYWNLGRQIASRKAEKTYRGRFFETLSQDLRTMLPDVKCFSPSNLRYMERFYVVYNQAYKNLPQAGEDFAQPEWEICPQVGEEIFLIPWGHHKVLIDKFSKQPGKALFFVRKTIENDWSRGLLENFVDTDLYERQGKGITNFQSKLPMPQGDLAQEMAKDPYSFGFIAIAEDYREKELKDALVHNITKFLLELGNGFAFMGREYRIKIGDTEQFIDMLFYNTNIHCYVVVEIKTRKFEADNLGQLGTYVSAVNHVLKKESDGPTIGLLICKTKDNVLAKYALEAMSEPIGISEYELSRVYPRNFKGTLPTIEEIEDNLNRDK